MKKNNLFDLSRAYFLCETFLQQFIIGVKMEHLPSVVSAFDPLWFNESFLGK